MIKCTFKLTSINENVAPLVTIGDILTCVMFMYNFIFLHVLVGCGDHTLKEISLLPDPCPLPNAEKKRSLNEKERLIYAPLSGVGGVVYDKVKNILNYS